MGFVLFIHVVACILLVISVLLQAGKGGGLAESFSSAESVFGTQTNQLMVRVSTVLAVIFFVTSLTLTINSSKTDRSLMQSHVIPKQTKPAQGAAEPTITVGPSQPLNTKDMVDGDGKVNAPDIKVPAMALPDVNSENKVDLKDVVETQADNPVPENTANTAK